VSNRVVENEQRLWVGALIPSTTIAIVALILSTILRHKSGLLGSLLASATVILFFSVHLLISKISTNLDPMITMALAMFSYFAKVIVMGVFLLLITRLTSPSTVDRTSFGVSAIAIAIGWLGGEIRAFFKLRIHLPLPERK
jgi:ATP synthase protein I